MLCVAESKAQVPKVCHPPAGDQSRHAVYGPVSLLCEVKVKGRLMSRVPSSSEKSASGQTVTLILGAQDTRTIRDLLGGNFHPLKTLF